MLCQSHTTTHVLQGVYGLMARVCTDSQQAVSEVCTMMGGLCPPVVCHPLNHSPTSLGLSVLLSARLLLSAAFHWGLWMSLVFNSPQMSTASGS